MAEVLKQVKVFPSTGNAGSSSLVLWQDYATELFGFEFSKMGGIGLAKVVYDDICRTKAEPSVRSELPAEGKV